MIGLGLKSDKGVSAANQEVLPLLNEKWTFPHGLYYEFSFMNSQTCTVIINGKDKNVLDANQGFQIDRNDVLIESVVILEDGIDYKWSGKYGLLQDESNSKNNDIPTLSISEFPRLSTEITDSPRIERALNSLKGGYIDFPITPGRYYTINKPIKLKRGVILRGLGTIDTLTENGVIFKLVNGANCSMLETPILNGGTATGYLAIENIVFDGNAENQTEINTAVKFHGAWIGSWIRNVLIHNVYGSGISFSDGSDVQINHLWVIKCYTDGYGIEINKSYTQGQGGYLNFNHLYIENIMPSSYKGSTSLTPRTDLKARGKGIFINRAISCVINELHQEGHIYGIDISSCHTVNINNLTGTWMGNNDFTDSCYIRILDDSTKVVNLGTGSISAYTPGFSFFKKASGVKSNSYIDLPESPYLSGYTGAKYELALPSYSPKTRVLNNLDIQQVGSFSPIQLRFYPNSTLSHYSYLKAQNEVLRLGTTVNQRSETEFLEIRSLGNNSDNVTILKTLYLPTRTILDSMAGINNGAIVNYDGNGVLRQHGRTETIATIRIGTIPPTSNADFIGQIYIDRISGVGYLGINKGNGASDWKRITE